MIGLPYSLIIEHFRLECFVEVCYPMTFLRYFPVSGYGENR